MPIQIRELVIRARVEPNATPTPRAGRAEPETECGCGIDADQLARLLKDRDER